MSGRIFPELSPVFLFAVVFLSPAFAADRETVPSLPTTIETQRVQQTSFAAEKLAMWQRRLHLDDWQITVKVCRASELRPDTLGNIHWDSDRKTATIKVMDVADYKRPFAAVLKDVETTVVHELIHLELSYLGHNETNTTPEERAVTRITQALLDTHRK